MKKRTRLFVFAAAGVLVFGLGTGLVASYMGGFQNFALLGSDGPAELDYIPADAQAIAYVNVRDVMDSELRKKITQLHPGTTNDADRFQQETGINLETDVTHVVVALSGDMGTNQRPLMIAKGIFNPTHIETLAREHGSVVEEYKGVRLLVHGAEVAVAFVEPGLVAVGTPDSVRRAIDTKAGGPSITSNDDIMRLVRDIEDGNAWSVANFSAITAGPQLPPEIASQLPPITWVAASGYVNGGVRGMIRVEARDEAAAQDLRGVVQGFVSLARLQMGQRAEFADLLNSLQIGGQGTTVSLGFSVPSEVIDAIGAIAARRPPAVNGGPNLQPRRPLPPALPAL